MSKKIQRLYLELITTIGDSGHEPLCADPEYQDLFFPVSKIAAGTRGQDYSVRIRENEAKTLCNLCPFKAKCAEYAIVAHEYYGVWGGTTPEDRAAIWRGIKYHETRTVIED